MYIQDLPVSVLPFPPSQTVPQVLICQEELRQAKHTLKREMSAQANKFNQLGTSSQPRNNWRLK